MYILHNLLKPAKIIMDLKHLTFLRFIVATWVVIFHDWQSLRKYVNPDSPIDVFLGNGNVAVPFFFTLSGFVLAINYVDKLNNWKDIEKYIAKRLFRIYPIYFISVFFTLYFEVLNHQSSNFYKIFINVILVQSWLTSSFDPIINHPSWSLSIEFFLYLIFPLLIFFFRKNRVLKANLIILAFITGIWQMLYISEFIYTIPNALSWVFTFSIGIIWGLIYLKKQYNSSLLLTFVGLSLTLSISFGIVNFWNNIAIFCFGVGFFIFLVSSLQSNISKFFSLPIFVKLGEISYSIYIIQFPLRMWFRKVLYEYNIHLSSFKDFLAFYIALCLLSLLAYEWIEKPIKRKLENVFLRQR